MMFDRLGDNTCAGVKSEGQKMKSSDYRWEACFGLNSLLFIKLVLVLLLVLCCRDVLRKRKKKQQPLADAIADADAREQREWRYARWALKCGQIIATVYLLWSFVRALLT
ncbi:hypothetical protein [Cronobacter sp. JZ38]|uniref:hypothetical protein n=1 Tax=Cronobacter sp. JZ38 TaxID=1906275 RepID=UPI0015520A88|nr:hypothetical protein [Cronobacter sp. JZ38]